MTDSLADSHTHWIVYLLTHLFTNKLTDSFPDSPTYWLTESLIHQHSLTHLLYSIISNTDRLIRWLIHWLTDLFSYLTHLLTNSLADSFSDSPTYWLTNSSIWIDSMFLSTSIHNPTIPLFPVQIGGCSVEESQRHQLAFWDASYFSWPVFRKKYRLPTFNPWTLNVQGVNVPMSKKVIPMHCLEPLSDMCSFYHKRVLSFLSE